MLLLGIIFTILGLLVLAVAMLNPSGSRGTPTLVLYAIPMIYLVPGVLYIVFSFLLRQRKSWAVVASLVLVSVHELMAVVVLLRLIVIGMPPTWLLIILLLWVAALAQLLYHLGKSFESIRARTETQPRGFEPLPVSRFVPPPPSA
jgi:hypothetical protein